MLKVSPEFAAKPRQLRPHGWLITAGGLFLLTAATLTMNEYGVDMTSLILVAGIPTIVAFMGTSAIGLTILLGLRRYPRRLMRISLFAFVLSIVFTIGIVNAVRELAAFAINPTF